MKITVNKLNEWLEEDACADFKAMIEGVGKEGITPLEFASLPISTEDKLYVLLREEIIPAESLSLLSNDLYMIERQTSLISWIEGRAPRMPSVLAQRAKLGLIVKVLWDQKKSVLREKKNFEKLKKRLSDGVTLHRSLSHSEIRIGDEVILSESKILPDGEDMISDAKLALVTDIFGDPWIEVVILSTGEKKRCLCHSTYRPE